MKRLLLLSLAVILVGCGTSVPRPSDDLLRSQLAILVNRANNSDNQSWNNTIVEKQLSQALPKGEATSLGWMLEWKPEDGALAYAIIPWSMLKMKDPGIKREVPYDGGRPATAGQVSEITAAVVDQIEKPLADLVAVHSIRVSGSYAAFSTTPLLPLADDAYGFARLESGKWQILDLGSSDVGCGIVPQRVLNAFKVRCSE